MLIAHNSEQYIKTIEEESHIDNNGLMPPSNKFSQQLLGSHAPTETQSVDKNIVSKES